MKFIYSISVLPLCFEEKPQKIIKKTDIHNVLKSLNQAWNVRYRHFHIKFKVIWIICIMLLTRSKSIFEHTDNLQVDQQQIKCMK